MEINGTQPAIASGSAADAEAIRQLSAQVTGLRAEVDQLMSHLRSSRERHQRDITLIGTALMEEAERRDWCGEYDEVVEDLNHKLSVELPTRTREYTVTYTLTVTVGVTAQNEDQAVEEARGTMDSIESRIDNNYAGTYCNIDGYEVEES